MTVQDENKLRTIVSDILGQHTARMDGRFDLQAHDLAYIKERVDKTNGRVNGHDKDISELKQLSVVQKTNWTNVYIAVTLIIALLGIFLK